MLTTAIALGLIHTVLGPDHYLPFIVIGRARRWSLARTAILTAVCGLGHVASSIVIGMAGAAAGAALGSLEALEGSRGELAGWSLLIFGVGYAAFGVWRAAKGKRHGHVHLHPDGTLHDHHHHHEVAEGHPSVHGHGHERSEDESRLSWKQLTPWLLFLVFVLGPCEPLIPLFFADAAAGNIGAAVVTAAGYGIATIAAMLAIVTAFWLGLSHVPLGPLERFGHALAGAIIAAAGFGMVFLGL